MIPKSECKDRKLYRIHSRNLAFGVFREETGGFLGLRTKFGRVYAFEEYHWENESFATVKPKEELPETLPSDILNDPYLGTICGVCKKPAEYKEWTDGEREVTLSDGSKMNVAGEWQHMDGTKCENMYGCIQNNQALEDWLHSMESKYRV